MLPKPLTINQRKSRKINKSTYRMWWAISGSVPSLVLLPIGLYVGFVVGNQHLYEMEMLMWALPCSAIVMITGLAGGSFAGIASGRLVYCLSHDFHASLLFAAIAGLLLAFLVFILGYVFPLWYNLSI